MRAMKNLSSWQLSLQNAISDINELFSILELDQSLYQGAIDAERLFAFKVPRSFVARMQKGNAKDPLLFQVLPVLQEKRTVPGFSQDPLQELEANPLPGLLHKYPGRILMTLTSACAINCRFCFRRHFPYAANNPGRLGWQKILDYIADDSSIQEVILSGGDPLILTESLLTEFTDALTAIEHIKTLRIHSRIPIVLPERITTDFINWLKSVKCQVVLVTHCNHPDEINDEVHAALKRLDQASLILLNQSVLLKGVNDNSATLIALSQRLFALKILPYYLHTLDKVAGVSHFDLSHTKVKKIYSEMQQALPGYLVPRLVKEVPGQLHKILI
jgi:L-lysine 2,3-aminomutase